MRESSNAIKLWWVAPVAGFLVLLVLAMLFGKPADPLRSGTSYDASDDGFRAAYLLLEELDYPVYRSRRAAAGEIRWLLFPEPAPREMSAFKAWLRGGGRVLLATNDRLDFQEETSFARELGLSPRVITAGEPQPVVVTVGGERLTLRGGGTVVDLPAAPSRAWPATGEPVATIHPYGAGEVWLLRRPEFLTNETIREADNGVILCRLAEAMLGGAGGDEVAFDEFYHGLRDRPGMVELLLTPPTLWVTLQGLLLLGLLLWRNVPRFGAAREPPPASRRSREEFLDAMASLLLRKADHADAYRTARDALLREMERDLGLPAETDPALVAEEAARSRGLDERRLTRLLTADRPPASGAKGFVESLNELETTRDEFFARTRVR